MCKPSSEEKNIFCFRLVHLAGGKLFRQILTLTDMKNKISLTIRILFNKFSIFATTVQYFITIHHFLKRYKISPFLKKIFFLNRLTHYVRVD